MASRKARVESVGLRPLKRAGRKARGVTLANASHVAAASPARALQDNLSAAIADTQPPLWSPRAALSLMFGASAAFWLLLAGGIYLLVR